MLEVTKNTTKCVGGWQRQLLTFKLFRVLKFFDSLGHINKIHCLLLTKGGGGGGLLILLFI